MNKLLQNPDTSLQMAEFQVCWSGWKWKLLTILCHRVLNVLKWTDMKTTYCFESNCLTEMHLKDFCVCKFHNDISFIWIAWMYGFHSYFIDDSRWTLAISWNRKCNLAAFDHMYLDFLMHVMLYLSVCKLKSEDETLADDVRRLLINLTRKQTSDIHKHEQKAVIENVEAVMEYRIYSRFITTICMIE